ncbi:hypothetical protein [Kribbella sindirgiensis]|uniref:Uncharacterized protein n=1 Tax=Kribbella sindirgiensis TaxID=1124744 RepID=A0A4R0IDE4_9ACTN|nr:hypothetical protein [Kribbella sindirgiensis]TCC21669.1 hypothetical protein E0H50_35945 [Kribbella sindirgiensis]
MSAASGLDQDASFNPDLAALKPEDSTRFRLARMLLLLDVARNAGRKVPSLDRLGYYEFFSDNPFIVLDGQKRTDPVDAVTLEIAGFNRAQLAYASSGQRFASRRRRLQHDVAQLVSLGLATLNADGYVITPRGSRLAGDLQSAYADAYRKSSEIVLRRLGPMTASGLESNVETWLGHSSLLLDLLDEVTDAVAPPLPELESPPRRFNGDNG